MIVIRDIDSIPSLGSAAVTIGFFDGFHIGHRRIIDTLLSLSGPHKRTIVVTFENHPLSVISPLSAPKMIAPVEYKLEFLESRGIDYLLLLKFDHEIMKTRAIKFLHYFSNKIRILDFVVGSDFRFGYKNEGDINFLKDYSNINSFGVFVVPPVIKDGIRISSSIIRKFIGEGKIRDANRFLGRDFFIEGTVIHGDGKGKKIGFPTVNIELDKSIIPPKFGVYKGYTFIDDKKYDCFIFVSDSKLGRKLNTPIIEAFIKGFDGSLYDKKVRIFFQDFIRGVINFENENDLREQISRDIAYFSVEE